MEGEGREREHLKERGGRERALEGERRKGEHLKERGGWEREH